MFGKSDLCWREKSDARLNISFVICGLGKSPQLQMRANNNKEVNCLRRANRPVVYISGDNNKVNVNYGEKYSCRTAVIIALSVIIGAIVLAVSLCCPELLAEFVRSIISLAGRG